ncbi:MAG TPA: hypothetical protein VEQ85_06725 [Lacipirellulaceae bacterium]|nr:hypothetical protein [Lacipirellulaceae bacterium]
MTFLCALALCRLHRAGPRVWAALFVGVAVACSTGCQALLPAALPGGFALNEEARIAKKARGDSFPSPADVGLGDAETKL